MLRVKLAPSAAEGTTFVAYLSVVARTPGLITVDKVTTALYESRAK